VPFYVAGKAQGLLTAAIAEVIGQREAQHSRLQTVDDEKETGSRACVELKFLRMT
jgi:hypothetical protein